jgi:hypothetical protein
MNALLLAAALCSLPAADEDKLLLQLDADFEELLKKETNPGPLREAAALLAVTKQNWTTYSEAVVLLRQHRSPAAVPLLLKYMVEHAEVGNGHIMVPEYRDTLTLLTGTDIPNLYRYVADRQKTVRDSVEELVRTWWLPNKERISTDLSRMSSEQLQVVVGRLLHKVEGNPRGDDSLDRVAYTARHLQALLRPDQRRRAVLLDEDLHFNMMPLLLRVTGYEERPQDKPRERDANHISFAALPLLAALSRKSEAALLEKIAADERQNSATRLTCLLAVAGGGGELKTPTILTILQAEKKLERRLVAVLALHYAAEDPTAVAELVRLLDDPNGFVRAAAVEALAGTPSPAALPALKRILDEPNPRESVYSVLRLLGDMGTQDARRLLANYLDGTLTGGKPGNHLLHALYAFEKATGKHWLQPGALPDKVFRDAARNALEWWRTQ